VADTDPLEIEPSHTHIHPDTGELVEFPVPMYHPVTGQIREASNPVDYVANKFDGYRARGPEANRAETRRTQRANVSAASTPEKGAEKNT